jgi:DDE superfamily endonuclease
LGTPGCTPFQRHRQGRRNKISVISGISLSPQRHRLGLYYLLFYDNIAQEEVCVFLRELLRHLRGPVIVLLDNSSTHQGEPLRKLLRQHPRLSIEHFPSYAPELNPDEGVGLWPSDNWPTVGPMTSMSSWRMSSGQWRGSEGHAQNYAAASSNQNFPFFCASHCII